MAKKKETTTASENTDCFVICPIGEPDSEVRARSDKLLKHIINPVAQNQFKVIRADKIAKPGVITDQILQHILSDKLVIADLTGSNANVFYELAIRHATRRAFVQVIEEGEKIPFDNFNMRTIQYGFDIETVDRCKKEMEEQIKDALAHSEKLTSPISISQDLIHLSSSANPLEKTNAQILKMLSEVRSQVTDIAQRRDRYRINPRLLEEFVVLFERLTVLVNDREGGKRSPEFEHDLRRLLQRAISRLEMLALESGYPPEFAHRLLSRL